MKIYIRVFIGISIFAIWFGASPVLLADGGGRDRDRSDTRRQVDPDFATAQAAIDAKQWDRSIALLMRAATRNEQDPDIYNLLGYAERNRGHLDAAFRYYERALALNPKHRGAHEYVGEAYLLRGDLPKAEEHLAVLDKLCFFPCEEYRHLKAKVTEYRQQH